MEFGSNGAHGRVVANLVALGLKPKQEPVPIQTPAVKEAHVQDHQLLHHLVTLNAVSI